MTVGKRYMAIWFSHLLTDRLIKSRPELAKVPFVIATPERGSVTIKAANYLAESKGIAVGMVVADCRAVQPDLQVFDHETGQEEKLLSAMAEWCIRYTPITSVDMPNGLMLNISGCAHLWGGELSYLTHITNKFKAFGYHVHAAIADTVGTAWAVCRFGQDVSIVKPCGQSDILMDLPPAALRLDAPVLERLEKLGLTEIKNFMHMPRAALRRRFGQGLLDRIDQALGTAVEIPIPFKQIPPYDERLPSMEPIQTLAGIEIALKKLLGSLCKRLQDEGKGLKKAVFSCYRVDGNIQQIETGTNRPSRNSEHLFKLFELKLGTIRPDLGIELFILEAPIVEELSAGQEAIWKTGGGADTVALAELLDRIENKMGADIIHRYLPAEHHWPERSFKQAASLDEIPVTDWRLDIRRPSQLLPVPQPIEVMVQLPDYPPIQFTYNGSLHKVRKADGPERIEREWWLEGGGHRDYYCVETPEGMRCWLFREGHYGQTATKWFLHGFFA